MTMSGTAQFHSHGQAQPARKPYDPRYDPLVAPDPGAGRAYAPTWWVASAGTPPEDDGPVVRDIDVDVAIIGSGATGMSTALYLAQEHGIQATVLEANQASWGCSSRSGGQGQNASGRLKRSQWIRRWGLDVARQLDAEIRSGFENFRHLTTQIDCDAFDGGHLYLAHRPEKLAGLEAEARVMREQFGYDTRMLTAERGAARLLRRARNRGRDVRVRGRGHPSAQVHLRPDARRRARSARRSTPRARCRAGRPSTACTICRRPAAWCARGAWRCAPAATRARR